MYRNILEMFSSLFGHKCYCDFLNRFQRNRVYKQWKYKNS